MIVSTYKGFFIVEEFNTLYDIRNNLGILESSNFNTITDCKNTIDKWTK
tara:strand:- start:342 stop:488 length:147 start_codon:yes stop_codon:yes gene_type:complete